MRLLLILALSLLAGAADASPRRAPRRDEIRLREEQARDEASRRLRAAEADEARGFFEEAAEQYEQASAALPLSPRAGEALARATLLRLGLGQEEEASRDAHSFDLLLRHKEPPRAIRIHLALARHHAGQKRWRKTRERLDAVEPLLGRYGTLAERTEAHALRARMLDEIGDDAGAEAAYRSLLRRPGSRPSEEAHEARFFLAERARQRARALPVPRFSKTPTRAAILRFVTEEIEPWYRKKQAAIERAEEAYQAVIDQGASPRWAVAAAARVGALWAEFVHDFRAAPIPPRDPSWPLGMSYYMRLDDASEPHKQRAKRAFVLCLDLALKGGYHDENVADCEAWLARNYRYEYPENDGYRPTPTLAGPLSLRHEPPMPLPRSGHP